MWPILNKEFSLMSHLKKGDSMNSIVSVDVSIEVHRFIKYTCALHNIPIRDEVALAVKYYKEKYGDNLKDAEIQNPLIYPTSKKPLRVYAEDKKYIDSLAGYHRGGISAAADRVIITYQNDPTKETPPPTIRVNWLDEKYLNWQNLLP